MKLPSFLALAPLAAALPQSLNSVGKAIYFLDNDPAGASIVSLKITNGLLSDPVRTSTGGKGLIGKGADGKSVAVDPVFSQGSVQVFGDRLFTVSSGSNTLSQFSIPESDPSHPVLLGKPVSTVGNVPNSVAYSPLHKLACVTNTGTKAGVQCFTVSDGGHIDPTGDFVPLPVNQTSLPPVGPTDTASDIAFSPDGQYLVATVKGDGKNPGYVYVWTIDGKTLSKPVVSRPPTLLVDFSINFLSENRAVVTDPAYGASYITIHPDLTVTVDKKITIKGESATCWAAIDDSSVYIMDAGKPTITVLDPSTGAIKASVNGSTKGAGNLDTARSGNLLYSLQATAGVAVYDVSGKVPSLHQFANLSSLGNRAAWTGMAVYEK